MSNVTLKSDSSVFDPDPHCSESLLTGLSPIQEHVLHFQNRFPGAYSRSHVQILKPNGCLLFVCRMDTHANVSQKSLPQ